MNSLRTAVILDTDIGTNIDDALCLAYLLKQPACELLAVTTTGRWSAQRAALAQRVLAEYGRTDVPVVAGAPRPLVAAVRRTKPWMADAVLGRRSATGGDARAAVEKIAALLDRRRNEVQLLTIGPLTNAARLFEWHPQEARWLAGAYSMCGAFGEVGPAYDTVETNVALDPEAAARFFECEAPQHHLLGLEFTVQSRRRTVEVLHRLAGHGPPILARLLELWREKRRDVYFHDPLVAAAVFRPELFTFEPARCAVRLSPPAQYGETRAVRQTPHAPHQLLRDARVDEAVEHVLARIAS